MILFIFVKNTPKPKRPAQSRNHVENKCRVLKGAGSQLVVSVCQHSGRLVAAKLFIGWQRQQQSSMKLLSCVCFILGMWYFSQGVLRHVFGVRYAVSVLVTSGNDCIYICPFQRAEKKTLDYTKKHISVDFFVHFRE